MLDKLLEGLVEAQTPAEKAVYIRALGNAGDRQTLPALSAIIRGDPSLAGVALHALRFILGEDVDALLEPHIMGLGLRFEDALGAVAWRDAARWAAPLTQLSEAQQKMEPPPESPISKIAQMLQGWARTEAD